MTQTDGLDGAVDSMDRLVATVVPRGRWRAIAQGRWLGHPLHPVLVDLPIGFWTSASVLDVVGGRRSQAAADQLVGLGVLSVVPTALAGLADWSALDRETRRDGVAHAAANVTATTLYAASFASRRRGRRGLGVALGLAGDTAATVGGYLGGHLVFRRAAGVDRDALASGGASTPPGDRPS